LLLCSPCGVLLENFSCLVAVAAKLHFFSSYPEYLFYLLLYYSFS
jgi:hypothetical protein